MKKVIKVCILLTSYSKAGGIERAVINLANSLSSLSNKYEVTLVGYCNLTKITPYEINAKVNLKTIFNKSISMKKGILKATKFLRHDLKNYKYDIFIGCGSINFPTSVLSKIGNEVKLILWEHSHFFQNSEIQYQKYTRKYWCEFADTIVTLTEEDKINYYKNIKNKNIISIPNMLDEKLFVHKSKYDLSSKAIISVGRLAKIKNFKAVIEVANIILHEYDDWVWNIYGEGNEKENLQEQIIKYNLEKKVFLKGGKYNIYDEYKNHAIYVSTSSSEGFGLTLIEALANNLPVIAFDVMCGPRSIIEDEVNGFLVEFNDITKMSGKIKMLIEDDTLREKMSKNTGERLSHFKNKEIIKKWELIFEKLLSH